jgi:hypothetical protein
VTTLERRFRLLLHAYPAAYRRDRAEEILGTLIETTPAGRTRPLARDIRALLAGGLRARGLQNRRLSTRANLRLAALLGCAVFLSYVASGYQASEALGFFGTLLPAPSPAFGFAPAWSLGLSVVLLILVAVVVVLAWLASRRAVAVGAIAAGTAAFAYGLTPVAPGVKPTSLGLLMVLPVLLALAALVLLSRGQERPPRLWLWLPGLIMAQALVGQLATAQHWYRIVLFLYPLGLLWPLTAVLLAVTVAWIAVDARPAIGLAIAGASVPTACILTKTSWESSWAYGGREWAQSTWVSMFHWLALALVLAMAALWRVRRQARL